MLENTLTFKTFQFPNILPRFLRHFNNASLELKDGSTVYFRQICAVDANSICEIYENMSSESLQLRFNGHISASVYRRLAAQTAVQCEESGFGVLAYVLDDSRESGIRPLAIAYYINLENHAPELALSVVDAYQNKGLGKQLLKKLFVQARKRGLASLKAYVCPENVGMRILIHRCGQIFYTGRDDAFETYTIMV